MRKTYLTTLLSLFICLSCFGQFTLSAKYESNGAEAWDDAVIAQLGNDAQVLSNGLSVHIGYWLKPLEEYRWNIIPEIGYATGTTEASSDPIVNEYTWNRFDLTINNHIYLMDMESDCNCPTFSKDGNFFTKGFFFNIAPGLSMNGIDHRYDDNGEGNTLAGDKKIVPKIGIGVGMDIGIHDLITITPIFNYTKFFGNAWSPFRVNETQTSEVIESGISQTDVGIRMNFRFDYVSQNRGFRR